MNKIESEEYEVLSRNAPNYFKDIFPYTSIPKIPFEDTPVSLDIPENLCISDSTFREGQQAISYIGEDNVERIFEYFHYIDNETGTIEYSEFFLYTNYHRRCIEKCLKKGFKFPRVVGWVRSKKEELKTAKELGLDEVGILMPASDYHIYKKFSKTRCEVAKEYIDIIEEALALNLKPRIHLEDITRADIQNFVIPFIMLIESKTKNEGIEIRYKLCDTLGLGVPYEYASLPRSVPRLINVLRLHCGLSHQRLEWHGHNDFYKAQANAVCAWLFGASTANCCIRGVGERTGIASFEFLILDLIQIKEELEKKLNFEAYYELEKYVKRLEL